MGRQGMGGGERPAAGELISKELDWDVWLGPAPWREYHSTVPAGQPGGDGGISATAPWGDMGCHYMDLVFGPSALRHPTTIAAEGPPVHPETCARHESHLGVSGSRNAACLHAPVDRRQHAPDGVRRPQVRRRAGCTSSARRVRCLPTTARTSCSPRRNSRTSHRRRRRFPIRSGTTRSGSRPARKGRRRPATSTTRGPLTETVLLGTVAYRVGRKIEWDASKLVVTNALEAAELIRRQYRNGWEL